MQSSDKAGAITLIERLSYMLGSLLSKVRAATPIEEETLRGAKQLYQDAVSMLQPHTPTLEPVQRVSIQMPTGELLEQQLFKELDSGRYFSIDDAGVEPGEAIHSPYGNGLHRTDSPPA